MVAHQYHIAVFVLQLSVQGIDFLHVNGFLGNRHLLQQGPAPIVARREKDQVAPHDRGRDHRSGFVDEAMPSLLLGPLCLILSRAAAQKPMMVVDINAAPSMALKTAVQVCAGLFNRDASVILLHNKNIN